jgi:hypothetical protein
MRGTIKESSLASIRAQIPSLSPYEATTVVRGLDGRASCFDTSQDRRPVQSAILSPLCCTQLIPYNRT